jgi:two-component system chemotaxis response regulator CheB
MPIKLLIVDDSALMRRQLTRVFEAEGDFQVQVAHNGRDALALNDIFRPDVLTLDVTMPDMDGLTALSLIMATRPVPVVMVSSLTERGALVTFEALALGAVDFVAKPGGTISLSLDSVRQALVAKVRAAARARLRTERPARSRPAPRIPEPGPSEPARMAEPGLVLIGVSTGGPSSLEVLLPALPRAFPYPVVVAQHMPGAFTGPFAARLDQLCALRVREVTAPTPLVPGGIYLGRGGTDVAVARRDGALMVLPRPEAKAYTWHPSADLLGYSALEQCPAERLIGLLLTGMGYDGAEAFAEIHRRGGRTLAESEDSAVVFGMPRALIERDGATVVRPLSDIAGQLLAWSGLSIQG